MSKIYSNGYTPEQQKASNHRYQAKQRAMRGWVDEVSEALGVTREQLVNLPTVQVAEVLRSLRPHSTIQQARP